MLFRRTLAAIAAALVLAISVNRAEAQQPVSSCPPPLKLAAGACVRACPGGYEDRGRDCVYRNLSR